MTKTACLLGTIDNINKVNYDCLACVYKVGYTPHLRDIYFNYENYSKKSLIRTLIFIELIIAVHYVRTTLNSITYPNIPVIQTQPVVRTSVFG